MKYLWAASQVSLSMLFGNREETLHNEESVSAQLPTSSNFSTNAHKKRPWMVAEFCFYREYEMLNPPGSLLYFRHPKSPLLHFWEKKTRTHTNWHHIRKDLKSQREHQSGGGAVVTVVLKHL